MLWCASSCVHAALQRVILATCYKIMASAMLELPDDDQMTGEAVVNFLQRTLDEWKKPNPGGGSGKAGGKTVKEDVRDW